MKKIRSILFLVIVFFTLQSCQTVKEGFTSQKKKSTDEFLVEKKSPLVMPPEFNELIKPKNAFLFSSKEVKVNRKLWVDEWLQALTK